MDAALRRVGAWLAIASSALAQHVVRTVTGNAGDELGAAVIEVGDQNLDGVVDLLVGSPGSNGGRGAISCVSGAHLATGGSPVIVWSLASSIAGARFGTAVIEVGDLTGDAATDYLVGAPGDAGDGGAIYLVDGALRQIAATVPVPFANGPTRFGQTLALLDDRDGDGRQDVAIGAPGDVSPSNSIVWILSGAAVATSTTFPQNTIASLGGEAGFGSGLASGFDLDGSGALDLAIGAPGNDAFPLVDAGYLVV